MHGFDSVETIGKCSLTAPALLVVGLLDLFSTLDEEPDSWNEQCQGEDMPKNEAQVGLSRQRSNV